MAGIYIGYAMYARGPAYLALPMTIAAVVTLAISARYRWAPAAVFFVCFVVGCVCVRGRLAEPQNIAAWRAAGETGFAGYVLQAGETSSGRTSIVLDTRLLTRGSEQLPVRIRVNAVLPVGVAAEAGEGLRLRGELLDLDRQRNPGGFDSFLYYRARGVSYTSFPTVDGRFAARGSLTLLLYRQRAKLASVYDAILPPTEAALTRSIILGDKSGLDDSIADQYRMAGIYHLLCVSGLHVSIISLIIYRVLGIWFSKRRAGILALSALVLYCIFTGAGISTVRAVLMAGVAIVGGLLFREYDLLASTAFAAVCLLIYQPLYLFDAGFQLSFSAVAGIGVLTEPLERLLARAPSIPRAVRSMAAADLAAIFGSLPSLLFHFYHLTPYAFLVNLLILPTSAVLVALGLVSGSLGLIWLPAGRFAAGALFSLLKFYEAVCGFFTRLPFSYILVGCCGAPLAFGLALAALAFARWFGQRPLPVPDRGPGIFGRLISAIRARFCSAGKSHPGRAVRKNVPSRLPKGGGWFYAAVGLCVIAAAVRYWPPALQVTMLDVGQGDAFVIRGGGHTFLLDGGGLPNRAEGANTGENVVLPYLDYLGVSGLDGVFVTHPDNDHIAGVIEVLPHKAVRQLYFSQAIDRGNELYTRLEAEALAESVPVAYLTAGDAVKAGRFRLNVIYPSGTQTATDSDNDTGLVLQLICGDAKVLFTADISADVEKLLSFETPTVLKLSHHGSKYSNGEAFLEKTQAPLAMVSTGEGNSYGLPAPEIVHRVKNLGIPLYDTAKCGAVTLRFLGDKQQKIVVDEMIDNENH
jgi:competence protein ComEC